jgi:hypothetical protein
MTFKKTLISASAIGAAISSVVLAVPSGDGWIGPGSPGLAAAVTFWKILGYESLWGVAVAWFANAVVYGAAAFFILKYFNRAATT